MKQNIKKLTVYLLVAAMWFSCIPVFATADIEVVWSASDGSIILSDTLDGELPAIKNSTLNTVVATYTDRNEILGSLLVVPVVNGTMLEPTPENIVLAMEEPCEENVATFSFYLKPSIETGVYAMLLGGAYNTYTTKYFEVNGNYAPRLVKGQIFQYDDYKKEIALKFKASSQTSFESWAAQKSKMTVSMSAEDKFVEVQKDDIKFDTATETMKIDTTDYAGIFPAFGSQIEGNVQQTTISIATQEYWGDDGLGAPILETFGLVIPEISAEGFAQGVDFEITINSTTDKQGVSPIIALYDGDVLSDCMFMEEMNLTKNENKVLPIEFKCEGVKESGNFVIKVFLWSGAEVRPITPKIEFPN